MSMTGPTPTPPPQQPAISNTQLALAVYVLYLAAFVTGITALIGVIIAYVKIGESDPVMQTHYRFQIRTFWISVLYVTVGTILCFVIIGIPILIWWVVWALIRNIKGILALNENKPIANPTSWMFG